MTLTEFLRARIAEDEAVARRMPIAYDSSGHNPNVTANTVQFCAPSRTLAECEAKRRIVAICHTPDPHTAEEAGDGCTECAVLYTLALPYAGHEDYREEWRP